MNASLSMTATCSRLFDVCREFVVCSMEEERKRSVLLCVAVCCSVLLQCSVIVRWCSVVKQQVIDTHHSLQCVAVCCSVLLQCGIVV